MRENDALISDNFTQQNKAPIPFSQQSQLPCTPDPYVHDGLAFHGRVDLHAGTTVEQQGITKAIRSNPEGGLHEAPHQEATPL